MNVEIAERLAARRKQAGLSQEALAEKLGVSRQAVSKWERSESSPDTDNLIALAKLYGVSLDELLYVDESIEDDVAFEASDRARARRACEFGGRAEGREAKAADAGTAGGGEDNGVAAGGTIGSEAPDARVAAGETIGSGAPDAGTVADVSAQGTPSFGPDGFDFEKEERGRVHVGPDGVHVEDGKDHVHVSWAEGVHVVDRYGQEVHVGWDGVRVNATDPAAAEHIFSRGPSFNEIDASSAKKWLKFPFWAIVLAAYLLLGIVTGTSWGPGLFLLFLIPAYYVIGAAVVSRRIAPMLCALYPLGSIAWLLWMIFMEPNWHGPAWVIFLTIPLVEICIMKTSQWWYRRKSSADSAA